MKYFILICCCCLLAFAATAQQMAGARAGYILSRMQFDRAPAPLQSWVNGLGGGVVFRTMNSPHLGLQLELLVEQKGWHLFPGTTEAYEIQEHHLSLPVTSVVVAGSGNLRLVINGGVYASYVFKEEVLEDGQQDVYPVAYAQQSRQNWQYGIVAGLGPAVKIGRNWLQLEGRFAYTLSNRLAPNLAVTNVFNESQQQAVTVSLVWLTQLAK